LDQALAEVNQRGGMKEFVAQLTIEGEVPTGMVAHHLHRLAVGQSIQILEKTHAQHQNRFDSHATIVGAVAFLQFLTRGRHHGINHLRKKTVAIGGGKETGREPGGGEQFCLRRKGGQTHGWLLKGSRVGWRMALPTRWSPYRQV